MPTVRPHDQIASFIELLKRNEVIPDQPAEQTPIVSIISSFFNANAAFEETFASLMGQSLQNFEWIIVDDCSTDSKAKELIEELPKRSLKIKTLRHSVNRGLAAGRNTGIAMARGRYLFFMDLDDLLDPTYLEKCVMFLETHPNASFVNSYAVGFQDQEYWWEHGFNNKTVEDFVTQNWVTAMLLYRKADFDRVGGFDESLRFCEDWERWLKAFAAGQRGWTIPEFLHCYRRTGQGLLLSSFSNATEKQRVEELIRERYKKLISEEQMKQSAAIRLERPSSYEVQELRRHINTGSSVHVSRAGEGKRILCLFPHLEVGGADKFNLDLLSRLGGRGYKITIATTLEGGHSWHEHFYQITSDIFHLSNYLYNNHWLSGVKRLIESRKIELVFIANSYISYYFLPALRAEYPEVTFVDYVHIYDPGWRVDGYPRISRQMSRFLDLQMVSCEHLAEYNHSFNPEMTEKTRVCYINVDADWWKHDPIAREELRRSLGIADNESLLLFPARLEPQKRPEFIVDIAHKLIREDASVVVAVLGSGSLLDSTQGRIRQLGIEANFRVLPPVSPEEMLGYYSASDILLLPTEYEGISMAIYEAMAMELPVVASDVGGQRELVVPGTGYLIPKGNGDIEEIQAYTKVLKPLIRDGAKRRSVGRAARQRVEMHFGLSQMCDRAEEIFEEARKLRLAAGPDEINAHMAEEMLSVALECSQLDQEWLYLNSYAQQLGREKDTLWNLKIGMEASRFWKLRTKWFRLKYKVGLTQEEI